MPATLDVELPTGAGRVTVRLHADGALEYPPEQLLFIADPHFGKAATFQHAGVPIPDLLHDHDLTRLSRLIESTRSAHLVILGDFFHSHHSQHAAMLDSLWRWRRAHLALAVTVILGNHDRHAGPPPAALDITFVEGPQQCGPFVCLHEPPQVSETDAYHLTGHIHPAIVLHDRDGTDLRLPCFWVGPQVTTLPAFGAFTGGYAVNPAPGECIYAAAQGEIRDVTRLAFHRHR